MMNILSRFKINKLYKTYNFIKLNNNLIRDISKRNKTYLPNNEWLSEDNGVYKIGIDKEGAEKMGELVYIDYNTNPNDSIQEDEDIVFLESIKAVESIKAPFNCIIIENNNLLIDNPSSINENSECEETNWIVKFKQN